jgi:hypothetical protein
MATNSYFGAKCSKAQAEGDSRPDSRVLPNSARDRHNPQEAAVVSVGEQERSGRWLSRSTDLIGAEPSSYLEELPQSVRHFQPAPD